MQAQIQWAIRPRPHHPGIRQKWVIERIGEPDAETSSRSSMLCARA